LVGVFPRRTVLVVIGVMAVMALIASLAPTPQRAPQTASTPPPRLTDQVDPDRPDVTATLTTANTAKPKTIQAQVGDQVQITVDSTQADTVELGDLDTETTEPGVPASFMLLADTPGKYPLVATNDERTIGVLEVR
jgi:hypothetical protein